LLPATCVIPIPSMVIKPGNGNVGVGSVDPGRTLDVADRMRVRGGNSGTAGIAFTAGQAGSDNELGFVGLPDDNHIGFWGNVTGWALTMDRNTGTTSARELQITGASDVAEHFEVSEEI